MCQQFKAFKLPPSPSLSMQPKGFDRHWCARGGEFEPCLAGVGNLNLSWLGWGIWTLLGWGGEFEPCLAGVENLNLAWLGWGIWTRGVNSFQWNISVKSLNKGVFKVNSLLLWAIGSEENIYGVCVFWLGQLKKVTAADFAFSKQIEWGIWTQSGWGRGGAGDEA